MSLALKIVGFSTIAAIVYGILHDQVTAHLCVEYFTVAHPAIFPTESPFLLVIGWGIIATWWVGLSLGIALALAACVGSAPKPRFHEIRMKVILLMWASATAALICGIVAAILFSFHVIAIPSSWSEVIPRDKHMAFTAVAWAHIASYATGVCGGLFVVFLTVRSRFRLREEATLDRTLSK